MDVENKIGISLTENYAMFPASSVSGYLFSQPQSQYFRVGQIFEDQITDYAKRKNYSFKQMRKWLNE